MSLAGKCVQAARSAMRTILLIEVTGIIPAMTGTVIPAILQRSQKIVKQMVVKKQLRADIIGTRLDLGLEILDFFEAVRRFWMAFGITGHADAEARENAS